MSILYVTWFVVVDLTRQCSGGCNKTVVTSVSASSVMKKSSKLNYERKMIKIQALPIASGVSTLGCIGAEVPAELGCKVLECVVNRPLLLALLLLLAELAAAAAAWAAWALLEPLEFLRCVSELMMEVERMGLRKGCILTLEAAIMRIDAANIWDVVPTVSYFFSLTCKKCISFV